MLSVTKQAGLALVTALIFLTIVTLLTLFAVQNTILTEKMNRLHWKQAQNLISAEQILTLAETELNPHCIIPVIAQNELISKPLSWWESPDHCQGNWQTRRYFYVIEKLGSDSCAILKNMSQNVTKNYLIEYFRITILSLDAAIDARELLQSTIIRLNNFSADCIGNEHQVGLGRQMWRELR